MEQILFSINAVLPIFLIILLGYILKHFGLIHEAFVKQATKIVFKVSLPCMVFQSVSGVRIDELFSTDMIALATFSIIASLIIFLLATLLSMKLLKEPLSRGSFIQGIFRSNFVIIGYPLILNLFGDSGLAKAALLTAFIMPLFNILAVIALTIFVPKKDNHIIKGTLLQIIKNPLIIAIFLALIFAGFEWQLPIFLNQTLNYSGQLALPLSLMCIGAFFSWERVKPSFSSALVVTGLKMVIHPILLVIIAYYLGFSGEYLGIIFILFASPTAVSSFAMAEGMENDSQLAAAIIIMTTGCAVFSIFIGVNVLTSLGLL